MWSPQRSAAGSTRPPAPTSPSPWPPPPPACSAGCSLSLRGGLSYCTQASRTCLAQGAPRRCVELLTPLYEPQFLHRWKWRLGDGEGETAPQPSRHLHPRGGLRWGWARRPQGAAFHTGHSGDISAQRLVGDMASWVSATVFRAVLAPFPPQRLRAPSVSPKASFQENMGIPHNRAGNQGRRVCGPSPALQPRAFTFKCWAGSHPRNGSESFLAGTEDSAALSWAQGRAGLRQALLPLLGLQSEQRGASRRERQHSARCVWEHIWKTQHSRASGGAVG